MNGWMRQLLLRCFSFFRRAPLDQELDAEMATHLEMAVADNVRDGMSGEEARRRALIRFGGREQAKEEHRDMRGLPVLEVLLQDVRFALHMFRKNLGFTIVALLTLGLGIGANTALFSIVNGVLLNPLPYQQPERLVALYTRNAQFQHSSISYPNFLDWRRSNESFSDLAAFRSSNLNLTGTGDSERLPANMISAAFFPILGVKPLAGRGFTEQEDQLGGAPVTLISEGFGKRKFGSSSEAVGKSINLNGTLYTIIGVIPGSFRYENSNFQNKSEVYTPLGQWNEPLFRDRRTGMGMDAVGRLKTGVTVEQANSDMNRLAGHLADLYPDSNKDSGVTLVPLKENVIGDIRPFLLVLLGCGRVRAADCLCERGQPAAGAFNRQTERVCDTQCAGSESGPHGSATVDGKRLVITGRRRIGPAYRGYGDIGSNQSATGCAATRRGNSAGRASLGVHVGSVFTGRNPVWPCTGIENFAYSDS